MSYNKMKAKCKEQIRERSYFNYLITALCSMFKWKVPDGVEERFLEMYLHESGSFAVQKQGEKFKVAYLPSRAGELNQYGDGMTVEGVTRGNGESLSGTYGEDIAICYNNITRTPDLDLIRYSDAFSQVDKAIMANVHWTILAPVLCADSDKTARAINQLVDDMLGGKLKCITSKDVLESLNGGNANGVYSVDITHPERIKNVQYQSELYDVLMRRFFNKYGLNIQNTSKHAQASVDEVHGLDSVSWVLPVDMLKRRKDFCDIANKLWGEEWDVEFAEPWKSEYKKYMAQVEITENEADAGNSENKDDSEEEVKEDENMGED